MSYFKKSPTLIIFFLLILVIIIFAFTSVLYQKALTSLNDKIIDRDNKIDILIKTQNELNTNLSKLNENLELQINREKNLSNLYTDLKTNKEKLEVEKINLIIKINDTEKELLKTKIDLNIVKNSLNQLEEDFKKLNNTYYLVLDDVKDICKKASELNISKCRKY